MIAIFIIRDETLFSLKSALFILLEIKKFEIQVMRFFRMIKFIFLLQFHILFSNFQKKTETIVLGAESIEEFLPMLENKNIGLVSNSSSILRNGEKSVHLLDTLIKLNQKFGLFSRLNMDF